MNEVVFLTGDFCSGSTLMFTLMRNANESTCLYEPLHGRLLQHLVWPPRPYEHHHHVGSYYDELKPMQRIPELFRPEWSVSNLLLRAADEDHALRRYLDYLIEAAGGHGRSVAIKENRLAFRLGWIAHRYPDARIVHIQRDPERQWASLVRRIQSHVGRDEVGQDDPSFNGFTIAQWCDDLAPHFPELALDQSRSGYERFRKLYARSLEEGRRHAHLVVSFEELVSDFDSVWGRIAECVGSTCSPRALAHLVVAPEPSASNARTPAAPWERLVERAGNRYAQIRVAFDAARRRRQCEAADRLTGMASAGPPRRS